jgi:mannose-6-phosphate isomerase-like protein (cupin superfamily)
LTEPPKSEGAGVAGAESGKRVTRGPVWGAESEDLNATILVWPAGDGPEEHVNDERDVVYAVFEGAATLTVDGERLELGAGEARIVAKGSRRAVTAGPDGVRYLTAHLRRGGLQPKRF